MGKKDVSFLHGEAQDFVSKTSETDKETMAEAKDAFIIFGEAYEGNDVDAFYLGDILRALGCTISNASVIKYGGAAELGEKRINFSDFGPILEEAKKNVTDLGVKEDYIEGLKVFDKNGSGLVSCVEVKQVLCSLAEKMEAKQADQLIELLGIKEDEDGNIKYMELIDSLLAFKA